MIIDDENGHPKEVRFSKKIHIRERGGYYYLDGTIIYNNVTKRVHKSTKKKVTNRLYKKGLEKNLEEHLWKLSSFYKDIQKAKKEKEAKPLTPTIVEYGEKSIKAHSYNRKEITQQKNWNNFENHIIDSFGERSIDSITATDLRIFQSELKEKGLKSKTIKNIRSVFNQIFEDAIDDGLITKNPFERVDMPKANDSDMPNPFSLDEIEQILKSIKDKYKPMFVLAFFTGMRWGEILALEWKHIDFKNDKISVKQALSDGKISTTKTIGSHRIIDMLDIVKEYLLIQKEKKLHSKWVFVNQYKTLYLRTDKINSRIFKPLLEKLNIEYRPIKQTRHSFASLMLSKGEDILWVSNMLGHSQTSTTLNIYAQYIQNKEIKRANFLNGIIIS